MSLSNPLLITRGIKDMYHIKEGTRNKTEVTPHSVRDRRRGKVWSLYDYVTTAGKSQRQKTLQYPCVGSQVDAMHSLQTDL